MYKNAARFLQRLTRSDFRLEDRLKAGRKAKRPLSWSKQAKIAQQKRALKRRKIRKKVGLYPAYVAAISPLIGSFRIRDMRPVRIANELNRRKIKTPMKKSWDKNSVGVLQEAIEAAERRRKKRLKKNRPTA